MINKVLRSTLAIFAAISGVATQAQPLVPEVRYASDVINLYVGQKVNLRAQVSGLPVGVPAGCYASGAGLPPGLKLDMATCTIYGTPLYARESLLRIRTRTGQESPLILNISQYGIVYKATRSNGYVGQAVKLVANIYGLSAGQSAECSMAPWGVPSGLKIDPVTCTISGNLVSVGKFAFVVRSRFVQDIPVVLNIARYGLVYPASSAQMYVGQSVSLVPQIFGLMTGQTAGCATSMLPLGLSLNPATCAITGVPLMESSGLLAIRSSFMREVPLMFRVSKHGIVYSAERFRLVNNQGVNIVPQLIGFASGQSPFCMAANLPVGLRIDPTSCAITGTVSNTLGLNREVTIQTNGFGSQTLLFQDGN